MKIFCELVKKAIIDQYKPLGHFFLRIRDEQIKTKLITFTESDENNTLD